MRGVVRMPVAGKITKGRVLECARLNLARTVDALRVTVRKQADHHFRCVGRLLAAVLALVGLVDGAQIQG